MSDEQFVNDLELQQLARILGGLPLRPSERERSRILLACGRAEGRAEAQRKIQNLRAGMLVFAGVSACLLGLLLNRPFAAVPQDDINTPQIVNIEPSETRPTPLSGDLPIVKHREFESFGVLTPRSKWDQEPRQKPENPSPGTIELVNQQPILTARSQAVLEELLN